MYEAKFNLREIFQLFETKTISGTDRKKEFSISTDSRNIQKNQIFLPIVGEKFDGHDFINQIFKEQKIEFAFCEKLKIKKIENKYIENLIPVENTLMAYHKLANFYRKKINPKVVAITGSSGKTTNKDLISTVLNQRFKVHKTEKNFNNEIGVPKTILEMPEDTEILVLEMAMRGKNQINLLSKTAEPDLAIITNVGTAHIGLLGSIENIVEAKCEIFEGLKKSGKAIVLADEKIIKIANKMINKDKTIIFSEKEIQNLKFLNEKTEIVFENKKYIINALGELHALNAILAIKTGRYFGLTDEEISKGLQVFQIPEGRGNIISLDNNSFLINESYNANPNTIKEAVKNLQKWEEAYKKIFVMGELKELGDKEEELFIELNCWLKDKSFLDEIITVGDKLGRITSATKNVSNNIECENYLNNYIINNSKVVVLIKASNAANLGKVVEGLEKRLNSKRRIKIE